jgi:NADH:ubiquinone oxidoreductase subunit E
VRGAQKVLDKIVEELNIGVGETTPDGLFTIDATRCLGCCGLAPVMMIDDDVYGKLDNVDVIPAILDKYRGEVAQNE